MKNDDINPKDIRTITISDNLNKLTIKKLKSDYLVRLSVQVISHLQFVVGEMEEWDEACISLTFPFSRRKLKFINNHILSLEDGEILEVNLRNNPTDIIPDTTRYYFLPINFKLEKGQQGIVITELAEYYGVSELNPKTC